MSALQRNKDIFEVKACILLSVVVSYISILISVVLF